MKPGIKTAREALDSLHVEHQGDLYNQYLSNSSQEIKRLLSSDIVQELAHLLPAQSQLLSSSWGQIGYIFSLKDIEGCLSFDAGKLYNVISYENADLVRCGMIPFFQEMGRHLCCVRKSDLWEEAFVYWVEYGFDFQHGEDPDKRVNECYQLPVTLSYFFDFLVHWNGEGSLIG